jgi:hypothetical protein
VSNTQELRSNIVERLPGAPVLEFVVSDFPSSVNVWPTWLRPGSPGTTGSIVNQSWIETRRREGVTQLVSGRRDKWPPANLGDHFRARILARHRTWHGADRDPRNASGKGFDDRGRLAGVRIELLL